MHKAPILFGLLFALIPALAAAQLPTGASEATRTVLCSLDPGETIMSAESMIGLAVNATDVILVTTKGKGPAGPFFVLCAGPRKGPFASAKDAMAAAYAGRKAPEEAERDCAEYKPVAPEGVALDLAEGTGGQTLRFKGATIGPHKIILSRLVTPDGALAYAASSDDDNAWFESSDGRKVSFGGVPTGFKVSPNGKNAAVLVEGRYSMNEMNGLSKLPPEKFAEAAKEMEKKYLYTIDGKKFGPFDSFDEYWYAKTSNDLYFRVGDQVFRNGAPMIKASSLDQCNFYPSPDGKSYAVFDYSSITFSDGKKYPAPLDVMAFPDKGKMVFRWIALENKKDLVVYQRAM